MSTQFKHSYWDWAAAIGSFLGILIGIYNTDMALVTGAVIIFLLNWRCMQQAKLLHELEDEIDEIYCPHPSSELDYHA